MQKASEQGSQQAGQTGAPLQRGRTAVAPSLRTPRSAVRKPPRADSEKGSFSVVKRATDRGSSSAAGHLRSAGGPGARRRAVPGRGAAQTGRPPQDGAGSLQRGRAAGEAGRPSRRAGPSTAVTKPGGFVTTCGSRPMSAAAPRHVPAFI